MNRARWISFSALLLLLLSSAACRALFPSTPEPAPTEYRYQPVTAPLKFDPPLLPHAKVGVPYAVQIVVTQNVTPVDSFKVDPDNLPPGLELSFVEEEGTDTATITGVPAKTGAYTFQIEVWCVGTNVSGQTGEKQYTIVVE